MAGDKPSWREIDQSRDRAGVKKPKAKSQLEQRAEKLASKEALKELDQLFSNSKPSKEKKRAFEEIKSKRGTPDYYLGMNAYVEKFGYPVDWEVQFLFLDHNKADFLIPYLEDLKTKAGQLPLDRQKLLIQKLKVMLLSTFDPDLAAKIKELQNQFNFKA